MKARITREEFVKHWNRSLPEVLEVEVESICDCENHKYQVCDICQGVDPIEENPLESWDKAMQKHYGLPDPLMSQPSEPPQKIEEMEMPLARHPVEHYIFNKINELIREHNKLIK